MDWIAIVSALEVVSEDEGQREKYTFAFSFSPEVLHVSWHMVLI